MQQPVRPVRAAGFIFPLPLLSGLTLINSLLLQHLRDVAARICQRIVGSDGVSDEKRLRWCDALRVRFSELLGKKRAKRAHAIVNFSFNHRTQSRMQANITAPA